MEGCRYGFSEKLGVYRRSRIQLSSNQRTWSVKRTKIKPVVRKTPFGKNKMITDRIEEAEETVTEKKL
jgi:hypothetical protein